MIVDDHRLYPVKAYLVISGYIDEVLINDQLISSLVIVIEDPAKGLWRLRGERRMVNPLDRLQLVLANYRCEDK